MPEYEPIIDDSPVLTREMIDRLMRAYTGTGGMIYQGMPGITTAGYAGYQDYDPPTHAPVTTTSRTYAFTTPAYTVEDISHKWEWLDLPASDGTDESWNEPEPEPCTETELTDFLGI